MPGNSPKVLLDLVGSFYEIAQETSSDGWSEAYSTLAELVNCGFGSIIVIPDGTRPFEFLDHTLPPSAAAQYTEYYYKVSPLRHLFYAIEPGQSFTRREEMPDDEFTRTEFYNEWARKYDFFNYHYGLLFRNPHSSAGVMLSKRRSRPHFTEDELYTINLVKPHLGRAYELHLSLARDKDKSEMIESAIDRVPRNVVLIDLDGRVVFANNGAKALLNNNDGLTIAANQTLRCSVPAECKKGRDLLRSAIGPIVLEKPMRGGTLQVSRPSGLRQYNVLVSPFAEDGLVRTEGSNLAIVFISDPEENVETVEDVLVNIYDLTPTEARVASLLTNGNGIDHICDLLRIKQNTVKTHLKHIFSKTETRRQSELIKLILRGPATIKQNRKK